MHPEQDEKLERLFSAYRDALPDMEPTPQFLPVLWQKIDAAKPVSWLFPLRQFALRLVAASALAAALMPGSALVVPHRAPDAEELGASYVDLLTVASIDEDEGVLWRQAENRR